jgi:large subunit ribosomal protein L9
MRVIFLRDIPNVAQAGEIREVSNGYARNYLIPKGLAVPATPQELKRIEKIKRVAEERRLKEVKELEALAQQLEGTTITVKARASPAGRFYGSITAVQIAQELSRLTERELDKGIIGLEEPIHEPGSYPVVVQFRPGVSANITVVAEAEGG